MLNDLTGQRFGRWTVIQRAADRVGASGYHCVMWHCVCDCGVERDVRGKTLTSGISKSCGCMARELLSRRATRHGGFGTRLYNIWDSMRQRCNNPNHYAYQNYGARGIGICHEWDDFASFKSWAIHNGYLENAEYGLFTLDRIDVNGDYTPSNCRFISMKEQSRNRRNTILIEHNGETRPLSEWSELIGMKYCTAWRRYKSGHSIFD